jgi:signal transduction histidine kinase
VATLENSVLFRDLSPAQLNALRWIAKEQHFAAGAQIFQQGDSGFGIYVIKEGAVDISSGLGDGSSHVLSRLGPGEFFGEMAVFDYKPRSAWAVAATDSSVYFIPRMEMVKFVEQSPTLATTLLREISRRLRDFSQKYVNESLQADRLAVVGRFARSIVHDLKNPLSVISLSAEVATRQADLPETARKPLELIRRQVDRIVELVAQILEFTGGAPQDEAKQMDYGKFLVGCIEDARAEAELKSVIVTAGPLAPVNVVADSKRLRRVLQNLAGNAIEMLEPGGTLTISSRVGQGEVVTEVRDTGPGIAPEILPRLFQPFATYGKSRGSGLGLSICKRIIEDHRGWIRAHNETSGGAVFAFGLPTPARS